MNPTVINEDYLVLRIGRLTVNLEAAMAQRAEAQAEAQAAQRQVADLQARVAELEDLVKVLNEDDDENDDDDE